MSIYEIRAKLLKFRIFNMLLNIIPRTFQVEIYLKIRLLYEVLYENGKIRKRFQSKLTGREKDKRVLFILGDYARDLFTYEMIKEEFNNRNGFWISHSYHLIARPIVKAFKPDILIVSEARSSPLKGLCSFALNDNKKIKILTLHGEGLVHPFTEKFWASGEFQHWEVVWGERTRDLLLKYGKDPKRIFITGNPRFDAHVIKTMNKKEFCKLVRIPVNKKIVLYTTNFLVFGKRVYAPPEFPVKEYIKLRIIIATCFLKIAKKYPQTTFLIKLHPSEVDDIYSTLVNKSKIKNCFVLSRSFSKEEVYIYDILPHIDILVHWSSTTSTEAWIHQKPSIAAQFVDVGYKYPEHLKGGDIAENCSQLENYIKKYLEEEVEISEDLKKFREEFLRLWYTAIDGNRSKIFVDLVDRLLKVKFREK